MRPAPGDVLIHARILGWMEDGGLPVSLELVEREDRRADTWDGLRAALQRVAAADGVGPLAGAVRALADERIARLAAGERLDDAPDGRLEALSGPDPSRDVVACALLLDDLRRLDREGRIAGEVGWAMRRWAWAELGRALRRLAAEAPDVHRGAVEAAERQLRGDA